MSSDQNTQLALDGERYVTFKALGSTVMFVLSQISQSDWLEAFRQMKIEVERDGKDLIHRTDFETPVLALVEKKLISVEGYSVKGGGALTDIPDWKQRIPVAHKTACARLLQEAAVEQSDSMEEFDPTAIKVSLRAWWGTRDRGMLEYSGLIHSFNPPDLKQLARFKRAISESRVIGGSRTGKTIYASRHSLFVQLYDELIIEVDGYSVSGAPLKLDAVKQHMDAIHKVVAVQTLFADGNDETDVQPA